MLNWLKNLFTKDTPTLDIWSKPSEATKEAAKPYVQPGYGTRGTAVKATKATTVAAPKVNPSVSSSQLAASRSGRGYYDDTYVGTSYATSSYKSNSCSGSSWGSSDSGSSSSDSGSSGGSCGGDD